MLYRWAKRATGNGVR